MKHKVPLIIEMTTDKRSSWSKQLFYPSQLPLKFKDNSIENMHSDVKV